MNTQNTMKEFILNLSDERLARLANSVGIYGINFISREQFAETLEKDWSWQYYKNLGVTPEQYYCNL